MPGAIVKLNGLTGALEDSSLVFDEPMICVIGREVDCNLVIPLVSAAEVSRHHCVITVSPPDASIQDLGSRNGTFVNGVNIGKRDPGLSAEQAGVTSFEAFPLSHGDVIGIGNNAFSVEVQREQPQASESSLPPQEEQVYAATDEPSLPADDEEKGQTEKRVSKHHSETVRIVDQMLKTVRLVSPGKNVSVIDGYRAINKIGQGGMGDVFMAIRESDNVPVALKIMRSAISVTPENRRDFVREMEHMKVLRHPNIVGIYEGGYSNGVFYMAIEYCEGGTIESIVKQRGDSHLSFGEAFNFILPILDALDYAHKVPLPDLKLPDGTQKPSRGLIHRDIKPRNIFLQGHEDKRIPKLADFGLSKAYSHAGLTGCTQTGFFSGTAAYISRQQFLNYKYAGPEVDVWAAAATFYFMLCGQCPRDMKGLNPFCAILERLPVSIFKHRPDVPKKLGKLLDTALDDSKPLKFKSAAEFKRALMEAFGC